MTEVENYDELSVADIVRRVRSRWWLVAAGVVLGALVAWLATDRGSASSSVRQVDLTFVDYSGTAEALGLPSEVADPPLPSAELGRVNQLVSDLELSGSSVGVSALDAQQTLRLVITGSSEDDVVNAAQQVVDAYRQAVVEEFTSGLTVVGEFAAAEADTLTERRDALVADLGEDTNAAIETELLVLSERINDATSQVRASTRLTDLISERLLTEGNATTSTSQTRQRSATLVLAGGVVGALGAITLLAALAIVDRKVRRRQQVARLLPGVPLLAVLGRGDPSADGEADTFASALHRRLEAVGADHVDVRAVGAGDFARRLGGVVPTTGRASAVLLTCSFGRASEDELTSAAQALNLSGRPIAGVVLGDVPPAERAWASAGYEPPRGPEHDR